jgi:hypothetical protein
MEEAALNLEQLSLSAENEEGEELTLTPESPVDALRYLHRCPRDYDFESSDSFFRFRGTLNQHDLEEDNRIWNALKEWRAGGGELPQQVRSTSLSLSRI